MNTCDKYIHEVFFPEMYSSYSLQRCKDLKNTFTILTSDFEDVSFIPKVKKYNLHDCHLHELGTRYIKGYKTEVRIPSIVENTFMREKHYKQKLYSCCKLQRCTKLLRDFAISWKSVHVFKTFMRSKIRQKHIHELQAKTTKFIWNQKMKDSSWFPTSWKIHSWKKENCILCIFLQKTDWTFIGSVLRLESAFSSFFGIFFKLFFFSPGVSMLLQLLYRQKCPISASYVVLVNPFIVFFV